MDVQKNESAGWDPNQWEMYFGLSLAIFAATLALNDLGAGKFGNDVLQLTNEKTGAYLWYQSKGLKESLVEGQRDLLSTFLSVDVIVPNKASGVETQIDLLSKEMRRYSAEKREILLGSSVVGQENWVQDIGGELGKVVGARQMEQEISRLTAAGSRFDVANLFLQLSLVIGAIGLLIKKIQLKKAFAFLMAGLGLTGATFSLMAYKIAGLF